MNNVDDKMDLLKMIANSMDCSIVYWNRIEDTIEQNIIISKILDTNSYITEYEYIKLSQKKWIGK